MGCCCSRKDEDDYQKLIDDGSGPSSLHSPARNSAVTTHSRFAEVAETWSKDIEDIFNRLPTDLPIATDIPRLAKKTSLVRASTGEVLVEESDDQDSDVTLAIKNLLTGIAEGLEDREMSRYLEKHFDGIMGLADDGDPSSRLLKFLRSCISTFGGVDNLPPTMRLLKLLHQKVIFPAYYCVKYRLGVESLKDTRGSWHIRISLNDDDDRSITVSHLKRQHFTNAELLPECDFSMTLLMTTDSEVRRLTDVRVNLADVRPSDALSSQRKLFYTDIIQSNSTIV